MDRERVGRSSRVKGRGLFEARDRGKRSGGVRRGHCSAPRKICSQHQVRCGGGVCWSELVIGRGGNSSMSSLLGGGHTTDQGERRGAVSRWGKYLLGVPERRNLSNHRKKKRLSWLKRSMVQGGG